MDIEVVRADKQKVEQQISYILNEFVSKYGLKLTLNEVNTDFTRINTVDRGVLYDPDHNVDIEIQI